MKRTFRHILLAGVAVLLVASCVTEDMFSGADPKDGEEVVMTFRPKLEDFESVTKTIGKGTMVDKLRVDVYEDGNSVPVYSDEYSKSQWSKIEIPFYYGKTYKVYFWAYDKSRNAYTIDERGLLQGVQVNWPDDVFLEDGGENGMNFDALEYLDAFYAVETINLSDNVADNTTPSLTRPFAQVNLTADKAELLEAKASKVIFEIEAATGFVPGGSTASETKAMKLVFESKDFFQSNKSFDDKKVYLGTTYIFVPSDGKLTGTLTLLDSDNKTLKGPSPVEIPLARNARTNLVFSGIKPATLPWNEELFNTGLKNESDGWIHISTPEQLAAFVIRGVADGSKVHICNEIDMSGVPETVKTQLTAVKTSFTGLTIDGSATEVNIENYSGGGQQYD